VTAGCQTSVRPPVIEDRSAALTIRQGPAAADFQTGEAADNDAVIVFDLEREREAAYFDLWTRLRDNLALQPPEQEARVDYWVQFFASRPKHLKDSAENARPFLHHILEELNRRDMPADLALLPLVESSFDPFAGGGEKASGLWQFMPVTGQRFGLGYEPGYQARRDIVRSTDAALNYLAWLNKRYDSWLLALAAYNAGEGRVDRALADNRGRGLPTDFWSLKLPQQTVDYVPKLLALGRLVEAPDRFGIHWPRIPNQPAFHAVEFPANTRLSLAANLLNVPEKDLGWLNPALERGATPHDRSATVLVPATKAEEMLGRLPELQALALANPLPPPVLVRTTAVKPARSPQSYTIKQGDTLWSLSRRFGVTVKQLRQWNRLPPGKPLRIGQSLTVTPPPRTITYRVRTGDSLWAIARRHGVRVSQLKTWNDVSSSRPIQPGQTLKIHLESI